MRGVFLLLREFAKRLLKKSPYDLTIPPHGGCRTASEQNGIYLDGYSQLDGYNKKSYHQSGLAIDIVIAGTTVAEMYDSNKLDEVNKIAKEVWAELVKEDEFAACYEMTFGCDWKNFKDRPHYQIKKIK